MVLATGYPTGLYATDLYATGWTTGVYATGENWLDRTMGCVDEGYWETSIDIVLTLRRWNKLWDETSPGWTMGTAKVDVVVRLGKAARGNMQCQERRQPRIDRTNALKSQKGVSSQRCGWSQCLRKKHMEIDVSPRLFTPPTRSRALIVWNMRMQIERKYRIWLNKRAGNRI